jgi:molecular chaperone GrpE
MSDEQQINNADGTETQPVDPTVDAAAAEAADIDAQAEVVEEELDELGQAQAERDEFKDLALRAKADFENYRKRADKRVAETRSVAIAGVVRELLPVVDNLDRAVEAAGTATEGDAFADGVRMVHADLHSVLDRLGLKPLDPTGETFDPNFHEAISQAPASEGVAAGTILEVVQKGFCFGDVVVRPARVVVAA